MRQAPQVQLSGEERRKLQTRLKSDKYPKAVKIRINVVLLAAQGIEDIEIANKLGVVRQTASKWRRCYLDSGIEGLEIVRPKPGRTPKFDQVIRKKIVRELLKRSVNGRVSGVNEVGKKFGVSRRSVWNYWSEYLNAGRKQTVSASLY